jgi:hypothetical protein
MGRSRRRRGRPGAKPEQRVKAMPGQRTEREPPASGSVGPAIRPLLAMTFAGASLALTIFAVGDHLAGAFWHTASGRFVEECVFLLIGVPLVRFVYGTFRS